MDKPRFLSQPRDFLRQKLLQEHMFGSPVTKEKAYANPHFPRHMLLGIFNNLLTKNLRDKNILSQIGNLVSNPHFPASAVTSIPNGIPLWIINNINFHINSISVRTEVINMFKQDIEDLKIAMKPSDALFTKIKDNSFISGGAIRHHINKARQKHGSPSRLNDIDIFLKSPEVFKDVLIHFINCFNIKEPLEVLPCIHGVKINTKEVQEFTISSKDSNGSLIKQSLIITENALTFSVEVQEKRKVIKRKVFQFISKVIKPSPEETTQTFDFAHCQGYVDLQDLSLHLPEDSLESIMLNKMIFKGGISPLGAFRRMAKLREEGMVINSAELMKMGTYLNSFDLCDPKVLKELLKGYYQKKEQFPELDKIEGPLNQEEVRNLLDYLALKEVRGS